MNEYHLLGGSVFVGENFSTICKIDGLRTKRRGAFFASPNKARAICFGNESLGRKIVNRRKKALLNEISKLYLRHYNFAWNFVKIGKNSENIKISQSRKKLICFLLPFFNLRPCELFRCVIQSNWRCERRGQWLENLFAKKRKSPVGENGTLFFYNAILWILTMLMIRSFSLHSSVEMRIGFPEGCELKTGEVVAL